jgi:2-succinyl-5-enolpyruvyl-6-hydroxy-3-cyclohexene-1-carboxylate synthase
MEYKYVSEKNHLILLSLLKAYGIKRVVASPGGTNITLVASMQHDSYFELYSCVDERSAAYMACGMAEQTGEPVIISCTGATSARNYMPGLTEAYYRKLPIVAITSTQDISRVGHLIAQVTDRSARPNDIVVESVHLQTIKDKDDEWDCTIKINKALSALTWRGGGPVHINLTTTYSKDYSIQNLPKVRKIERYTNTDAFPQMMVGKIGVFVGAHPEWSNEETESLDCFCATNNAVVFCDQTSNYRGKYRIDVSLVGLQTKYLSSLFEMDLLIHIGEMSGAYDAFKFKPKEVWRVNEDGEIRDQFRKLTKVFDMPEIVFFNKYSKGNRKADDYYNCWSEEQDRFFNSIPDLPFSNLWIAHQLSTKLPSNSILYLGILNSLRSWNYFKTPDSVIVHSNTGGFGIDGILSTAIGSSFGDTEKLNFVVLGDLSFFYDMNSLGNRHVGNNIRILVVNNGKGMEFRLIGHHGSMFGDETDKYIAAAGHHGYQSFKVIKHWAEDLGYEYLFAKSKEEFLNVADRFLTPQVTEKPMVLEVFTSTEDETGALKILEELQLDTKEALKYEVKSSIRSVFGEKGISALKKVLK